MSSITELKSYYDTAYKRDDYLSPVTIQRYEELLDMFEPYRQLNRILEVGCGVGYFLERARMRGWDTYGVEISSKAVSICRGKGINMFEGRLVDAPFEKEYFDVIVSIETIEHINNPNDEVAMFRKLLRKGGAVYVTTPNFNSILRYILQEKYDVICYPEHLCYYTPKTLNYLFKRHGFKKKYIITTGISVSHLKKSLGMSNARHISPSSDDEIIRVKIEKNQILKIFKGCANHLLTLFGIGDNIKAFFVKKC